MLEIEFSCLSLPIFDIEMKLRNTTRYSRRELFDEGLAEHRLCESRTKESS